MYIFVSLLLSFFTMQLSAVTFHISKDQMSELSARTCCIVDEILDGVNGCCSMLAEMCMAIQNDVDAVKAEVDALSVFDTIIKSDVDSVSIKSDGISGQVVDVKSSLDACCKSLSMLDAIIKSDIDSVSSTLNTFVNCTLGTQITQAMIPYTISAPGHYYLCGSVNSTGANAITIAASDVYLDLNGFVVTSTGAKGIVSSGAFSDITIENGFMAGTSKTIDIEGSPITNLTIRNIISNANDGMLLIGITNLVVENCSVSLNGQPNVNGVLVNGVNGRCENVFVSSGGSNSTGFSIINCAMYEFVNCTTTSVGTGFFNNGSGNNILFSNCVATLGLNFGFRSIGDHLTFEDCVAIDNAQEGFIIFKGTDLTFRNCLSTGGAQSGFRFRVSLGLVCEGCIANYNAVHGFHIDSTTGADVNCVFDNCLATNNAAHGFVFDSPARNGRISNCTASGNGGCGIADHPASVGTFIVDSRSQHAATSINPAYNLNSSIDILFAGADTVIVNS